jgi:hypothetical protein
MAVTQLICGLVVFCCVVIHYSPITTLILTTTVCTKWHFYGVGFWCFLLEIALQQRYGIFGAQTCGFLLL